MSDVRRFGLACAACIATAGLLTVSAQQEKQEKQDKDVKEDAARPKIALKATPPISMSPSRIVAKAELNGGADDFEEFYCPTVEWDWGDGTTSESTSDCEPYEPGKSEIKRRFTTDHVFHAGNFRVALRLKKRDKMVASATVMIEIRPGIRDL